jgi:hypothetical protein
MLTGPFSQGIKAGARLKFPAFASVKVACTHRQQPCCATALLVPHFAHQGPCVGVVYWSPLQWACSSSRGPRYGPPDAHTTPCRVKPQHTSGLMADAPCGERSARTPPRLLIRSNQAYTLLLVTPAECSMRPVWQLAGCKWRCQQPRAARGRQFVGPACHAALLHGISAPVHPKPSLSVGVGEVCE